MLLNGLRVCRLNRGGGGQDEYMVRCKNERMKEMMRYIGASVLATMLVAGVARGQDNAEITVETMPPSVVKTVPQAGGTDVDPSLKEITVAFSKDMLTENMWSWVIHTKESFPEIAGEVRYLEDGRTNVLPVRLYPGRKYAIWFNSPNYKHSAFRGGDNNPAVPYLLVFETRQ